MQHQLVLQFEAGTVGDYDAMVAIEDQLSETLGEPAVDGHDMGAGEANIFLLTSDPEETFRQITPLLERAGRLQEVTIAYRRTDEDDYHVLWPKNFSRRFAIS